MENGGDRESRGRDRGPSLFNDRFPYLNIERFRRPLVWKSLTARLIATLTLAVVLLMTLAGYVTYRISQGFISSALERSTRLQVMAMRHEIETFLEERKRTLLLLANKAPDPAAAPGLLDQLRETQRVDYRSLLFVKSDGEETVVACAKNGKAALLPAIDAGRMAPDPLLFREALSGLAPGAVWLSDLVDARMPCTDGSGGGAPMVADRLVYMGTRSADGYLVFSFSATALRNILSVFSSNRSPIHAFQRTPEVRYSYLFDRDGWILFQSEDPAAPDAELGTYLARDGFDGTLGREDLPGAFRPASRHGAFWKMVSAVREGRHDGMRLKADGPAAAGKELFLAYAPVRFSPEGGTAPRVYAGIAYMDVSRLTTAAGYKHIDAMFLIVLLTAVVVAAVIALLGHLLTRPILRLADQVRRLDLDGRLEPIELSHRGSEFTVLRDAINQMIATVNHQVEEIRQRDITLHHVSQRVPVDLDGFAPAPGAEELSRIPGIIGSGTRLDRLRSEILKAARVDADVMIQGETGTGKQLAAEAIHVLSSRASEAFISINCGALDEHLLLDTLFGHVRGAFTEARTDRKGAFLQADGGTLFLDEIQSASPKVQQALLRAISMRCIRPLGSDAEVAVNVRLIAAANVDLRQLIEKGMFREDLYFRLMVIPIQTPPLREMPGNIPVLANHFLRQHREQAGRDDLAFSRGALEKLCAYRWPGNIRELQHCILRAVVMTDAEVIQADDVALEGGVCAPFAGDAAPEAPRPLPPGPGPTPPQSPPPPAPASPAAEPTGLNDRQCRAWPRIVERGSVRRQEYQEWCGEAVSTRTAVYDLQNLVRRGLLVQEGRGRSVRYVLPGTGPPPGEGTRRK